MTADLHPAVEFTQAHQILMLCPKAFPSNTKSSVTELPWVALDCVVLQIYKFESWTSNCFNMLESFINVQFHRVEKIYPTPNSIAVNALPLCAVNRAHGPQMQMSLLVLNYS